MSDSETATDLASRYSDDEKSVSAEDNSTTSLTPHSHKANKRSSLRFKLSSLIILACGIALLSLLRDFVQTSNWEDEDSTPEFFQLVKNSVPTPAINTTVAILENFQVYQPVLTPSGATDETTSSNGSEVTEVIGDAVAKASSCAVLLMEYSFGYSYGVPFVGNFTPPKCKFNRVTMNFTVTSKGRQFDRLAIMYFGDIEVWRTSTSEPTTNGIRWEYTKDMTEYLSLWESPQKIIFDLGNIIDSTYTGFFNTTLTATFFSSEDTIEPADLILPISARKGAASQSSMFVLPADVAANNITLPRNVNRAVFSVSACGQATEEFWWSNVLQSNIDSFEPYDGTLYGYSPFREVQVLIDGQLAGVHWPFPVIFTGGVVPGLWRPIAGIDTYDLREHEIDITPFLGILCDGKPHSFEIRVAGIVDNGAGTGTLVPTVGNSWYVTGKIFLYLDSNANSTTTGTAPVFSLPTPSISLSSVFTQDAVGANETLSYTTNVKRSLSLSSKIKTQSGSKTVKWSQNLAVTNYGLYTDYGAVQLNKQNTIGSDASTGGTAYSASYKYPLYANTSYIVQASGNYTIGAEIVRGLDLAITGSPVFPTGLQPFGSLAGSAALVKTFSGTALSTTQNGTASYFASPSAGISSSFGTTSQDFTFSGVGGGNTELYYRSVEAVNSTVVRDVETLIGVAVGSYGLQVSAVGAGQKTVGVVSPKQALGRGPGKAKEALIQGGA